MQHVVGREELAALDHPVAAAEIGDEAARLLTSSMPAATSQRLRSDSQKPSNRPAATQARSSAAEPSRRMPATSGATAPKMRLHCAKSPWPRNGNAGRDQRIGQVAPRRNAQALLLQPGAPALFGPEALVGERLIDQRRW